MLAVICIVLSLLFCGCAAQGGGPQNICHSNHQQLTEDQVIQTVVNQMDKDSDGDIHLWELYVFFTDLLGRNDPAFEAIVRNMTEVQLIQATALYLSNVSSSIDKEQFATAWHNEFHDSLPFIRSVFDRLIDFNHNGVIDGDELFELRNDALNHYDANDDGVMQKSELVTFFESIYHSDNCVDIIG